MRSITFSLILGSMLVFAAQGLARGGEDEASTPAAQLKVLRAEVDGLQKEVRYLRSREDALTRYAVANEARAAGLQAMVKKARIEGFEANRIPANSRVTLMAGLEKLAASLRADLPKLTKKQTVMLKAADAAKAAAKAAK
jgi:hypothetical protein